MDTTISVSGSGKVDVTVFGRGTVIAGNGNDSIDIKGVGQIIIGSGQDTLTLEQGGVVSQTGAAGQDTINIGTGNATVYEAGHATISGAFGSVTVSGGMVQITQTPSTASGQVAAPVTHVGAQEASAGALGAVPMGYGNNLITGYGVYGQATQIGAAVHSQFVSGSGYTTGSAGSYSLVAGSGHDTMHGGSGHNLFEFVSSHTGGSHLIQNFVSGQDQLYVEGNSLSFLQQNHDISTHGGNTYISIDGGKTTIELQGVTSLKTSDITGKH